MPVGDQTVPVALLTVLVARPIGPAHQMVTATALLADPLAM